MQRIWACPFVALARFKPCSGVLQLDWSFDVWVLEQHTWAPKFEFLKCELFSGEQFAFSLLESLEK